jgi:hypothetical protein
VASPAVVSASAPTDTGFVDDDDERLAAEVCRRPPRLLPTPNSHQFHTKFTANLRKIPLISNKVS